MLWSKSVNLVVLRVIDLILHVHLVVLRGLKVIDFDKSAFLTRVQ